MTHPDHSKNPYRGRPNASPATLKAWQEETNKKLAKRHALNQAKGWVTGGARPVFYGGSAYSNTR